MVELWIQTKLRRCRGCFRTALVSTKEGRGEDSPQEYVVTEINVRKMLK